MTDFRDGAIAALAEALNRNDRPWTLTAVNIVALLDAHPAARAALAEWLWPAVVEARAAVVEMVEWNHDHGWSVPYHIAEFAVTRPDAAEEPS